MTKWFLLAYLIGSSINLLIGQSDAKALEIVQSVEEAMGGVENYNDIRYLAWNFLGSRLWVWDKWTGDVRCDYLDGSFKVAMNIHDRTGTVYAHNEVQTHPDSLTRFLDRGYRLWINDSYWLVMPWKLKDPGTTVKYLRSMKSVAGEDCDVIELTFQDVGVTPDNKYHIYVDKSTSLVCQWDFFSKYDNPEPEFQRPWTDYKRYGKILLSSGRGQRNMLPLSTPQAVDKDGVYDLSRDIAEIVE